MVEQPEKQNSDGFSPEWLTLREPADHIARSGRLTEQLAVWARVQAPLNIMEMGCGTGSNLRYLCPHLGHEQSWTLLDYDKALLKQLPLSIQQWGSDKGIDVDCSNDTITLSSKDFSARVRWQQADLANELDTLPFETTQLVTASALLDLTSQSWLQQLAAQCIQNQCASLFVLNYDGRISWQPEAQFDAQTADLLNEHQLGDKGFGPAMGPLAGHTLAQLLSHRQQTLVEQSDWQITPQQQDLQTALIDGWLDAATQTAPDDAEALARWHRQRHQHIASMESVLTVGHNDILSLPLSHDSTTG